MTLKRTLHYIYKIFLYCIALNMNNEALELLVYLFGTQF
jgi:hypothetical protein